MVKGVALGSVQLRTSGDTETVEVVQKEICPGCVEDILTIVSMEVEPKERSYSKPFKAIDTSDPVSAMTEEQLAGALLERLMKIRGKELTAE
jgi:hypothetical protein